MAHIQRGSSTFEFLQPGNGQIDVDGVIITGVAQDFIPKDDTGISGPDFGKTMATVQLTFNDFIDEFTLHTSSFNSNEVISGYNIGKPTKVTGNLELTHRGVESDVYGLQATGEGDLIWTGILTKTVTFRITASGRSGVLLKGFSFARETNAAPVANITTHDNKTEINVGQTHILSALGSSDADNDRLSYRWRVIEQPEGADVKGSNRINLSFRAEVVGDYTFELVVNDGKEESEPKLTKIKVVQPNRAPFATVRAHFLPQVNQPINISSVTVSDLDYDELNYHWDLTTPEGSNSTIDEPTALNPTFTPDMPGKYISTLIVNDGSLDSRPATATWLVSALPKGDPIVHAGVDNDIETGVAIFLDATRGEDSTYHWAVTDKPKGSKVSLAYVTLAQAQFKPDLDGKYTIQVKITNSDGTPEQVVATYVATNPNNKPIAMIEKGGLVNVDTEVQLSSEGSTDPDGDTISYLWTLITPQGSTAELSDATAPNPTFTPDIEGGYSAILVVNDGQLNSDPVEAVWDAHTVGE